MYLGENTLQLRSWGSDVEVTAAATLLQTTIVIYTSCIETTGGRVLKKLNWGKMYLRNICQHFQRLIPVLWLPHGSLFQVARTAASINCQVFFFFFLINRTDWFLFRGSYFAVKFCWRILKLLKCLKFCVGDINGILFLVGFPLCCECFKFASHLTKSLLFRSFHVMIVSFQMPVAPYCVLM